MALFRQLEGDVAIVSVKGLFKQVPIYERNGFLYAGISGGFIRLYANGSTSKPNVQLNHLDFEGGLYQDNLGRLCTAEAGVDKKPLAAPQSQKLLTTD